jgi:3-dehydroquinate dehydratase-2
MHLLVINGPNLNLLGTREPAIYGSETLGDLEREWHRHGTRRGVTVTTLQTNHEGKIVDAIQEAAGTVDGLILNAGALTHTSRSIPDAISATGIPTVEVHISNIYEREPWRATSYVSPVAEHVIYGRGPVGYTNAIDHLVAQLSSPPETVSYGDEVDHTMDIRVPDATAPAPIVVLLHGGFWKDIWTRDIMGPLAVEFSDRAATFNVEYRRGRGSFPASVDDVNAAVDWILANASGHNSTANEITIVGHSAGGYLALKLAERRTDIAHVVALAPAANIDELPKQYGQGDPATRYLNGSPTDRPGLWSAARLHQSPRVPVTVIHGADDDIVPPSHSTWYAEGTSDVSMIMLPETGHFEVVDPTSEVFESVRSAVSSG